MGQNAVWVLGAQFTNSLIDRPARTSLLDSGAASVQSNMADFCFARQRAMKDCAVDDEPSTNPAAERHVKNRIAIHARPAQRFGERGDVGVIMGYDRRAEKGAGPTAQLEVGPTLNVMRATDAACFP